MKIGLLVVIFIFIQFHQSSTTNRENEISLSILRKLSIGHCIVVEEELRSIIPPSVIFKYLAKRNIFTTYMRVITLFYYLRYYRYANFKTAVILTETHLADIFNYYFLKGLIDFALPKFTWIVFEKPMDLVLQRLNQFYIPFNCQFYLISAISNSYYEIHEIYNAMNNTKRLKSLAGFWSQTQKLQISSETIYQRSDMYGAILVWSTQYEFPCEVVMECLHLEIVYEMSKMLNFSVVLWWLPDYKNIPPDLNAALEGDTRCVVMYPKYYQIDSLGPTFEVKSHFYINNIGQNHGLWTYMAPFSKLLWIYILIYLSVSAFCSVIIQYWVAPQNTRISTLVQFIFVPLDIISNQFGFELPENLSPRLSELAIRITACVIVPAYSGAVISFLTVSNPKLPFTDLATFIDDGTYLTGGMIHAFSHNFFLDSSDPTVVEIKNKFLTDSPSLYLDDAMWRVCNSKYAFVGYENELPFVRNRLCDFLKIPKPVFSGLCGLNLRRNSPYRKYFQKNLLVFYASGIMKKMKILATAKFYKIVNNGFVPIDLMHFKPLIQLFVISGAISLIIFFIEISCKLYKKLIGN